ncbi:MAG: DUF6948 domain-containing protein [Planctomycetota bacterium]|jgi:hypothetical protein
MSKKIPAIVCAGSQGRAVVYGYVDALPEADRAVTIRRARMVLRWPISCGGLFGLAANGPRDGLRLTSAVESTTCTARQALAVSPEAAVMLDEWPDD